MVAAQRQALAENREQREMAERIILTHIVTVPETGDILGLLEPDPSEAWISRFDEVWNNERRKAEQTLEPLGRAEIIPPTSGVRGYQLRIKSSGDSSWTWQQPMAERIIAYVNSKDV